MKKIISLLLIAFIISVPSVITFVKTESANSSVITEAYEYPITPDTADEWTELRTIKEKAEACQIPEDILSAMTTEALIETVSDYPLCGDIYAFDSLDMGYQIVKERFNGLAELEKRAKNNMPEVEEKIDSYIKSLSDNSKKDANIKYYFIEDIEKCIKKEII